MAHFLLRHGAQHHLTIAQMVGLAACLMEISITAKRVRVGAIPVIVRNGELRGAAIGVETRNCSEIFGDNGGLRPIHRLLIGVS